MQKIMQKHKMINMKINIEIEIRIKLMSWRMDTIREEWREARCLLHEISVKK